MPFSRHPDDGDERPALDRKVLKPMKKSLAAYTSAVAFVALAMFAPTKAAAQVNIYVGPGGYAHYGYGYGYPHYGYGYYPYYGYGYRYPYYGYGYGYYPRYGYGYYGGYWRRHARRHWRRWHY
jgi:hypothetical protein